MSKKHYLYTISKDRRKGNIYIFMPSMFSNRLQPDEREQIARLFPQDRAEFDLLMRELAEKYEYEYDILCNDETITKENK